MCGMHRTSLEKRKLEILHFYRRLLDIKRSSVLEDQHTERMHRVDKYFTSLAMNETS